MLHDLLLVDETKSALRCGTRIEALDDVALHATVPEVNVALVANLVGSSSETAVDHGTDEIRRVVAQACHIASVGSTAKIPLKHCVAERVGGATLSYAVLIVGHVVGGGVVGATSSDACGIAIGGDLAGA